MKATDSATLPCTPGSDAATLVLPGHASEDEVSPGTPVGTPVPKNPQLQSMLARSHAAVLRSLRLQLEHALDDPSDPLSDKLRRLLGQLKEQVQFVLTDFLEPEAAYWEEQDILEVQARGNAILADIRGRSADEHGSAALAKVVSGDASEACPTLRACRSCTARRPQQHGKQQQDALVTCFEGCIYIGPHAVSHLGNGAGHKRNRSCRISLPGFLSL